MLHDSAGAQSALVQRATCGLQPALHASYTKGQRLVRRCTAPRCKRRSATVLKVDGGGGGSQSGARGLRGNRPRPLDEGILEEQVLDAGAEEGLDRFARRVDDRLPLHV